MPSSKDVSNFSLMSTLLPTSWSTDLHACLSDFPKWDKRVAFQLDSGILLTLVWKLFHFSDLFVTLILVTKLSLSVFSATTATPPQH